MPYRCVYSCLFPHIAGRKVPLPYFSPFYQRTQGRKGVHSVFCKVFPTTIAEAMLFFVKPSALPSFSARMGSQLRTFPKFQTQRKGHLFYLMCRNCVLDKDYVNHYHPRKDKDYADRTQFRTTSRTKTLCRDSYRPSREVSVRYAFRTPSLFSVCGLEIHR